MMRVPIKNPFKSTRPPNTSLEGMPLHQEQAAMKSKREEAKKLFDGLNSKYERFRWRKTPGQNELWHQHHTAEIKYAHIDSELQDFTKKNKEGLKAEAKAGANSIQQPAAHTIRQPYFMAARKQDFIAAGFEPRPEPIAPDHQPKVFDHRGPGGPKTFEEMSLVRGKAPRELLKPSTWLGKKPEEGLTLPETEGK
jgi:hypothetical protein